MFHPNLSYRSTSDLSKMIERHSYGDSIKLTGEEFLSKDGKTRYKIFEKNGEEFGSYNYFLIDNVQSAAIINSTYI